jgi:predicted RNA binding protein YcfA (HicA-like mRNA interferase family)
VSRLPSLSWQQVVGAIGRAGFLFDRQKGSHMVYYHPDSNYTVVVPRHRIIKTGTLREILKEANLSREEFRKLLH